MQTLLIPMGLRCNAAIVTKAIVSQPSLPFDWTQMNIESMKTVLQLKEESIRGFWETYFSTLDETNHNQQTNSWFPHDLFGSPEETRNTVDKYERRTKRLLQAFDSPTPKVFLIFFGFPESDSLEKTAHLIMAIRSRVNVEHSFIVCNAKYDETTIENIHFIYEKLPEIVEDEKEDSWSMLTKHVEQRVRKLVESLNLEAISL
jgi:hypothetical protein